MNTKQLLEAAKYEITVLRKANEILAARVDTLDIIAVAMGMRKQTQGFGIDVVPELEKAIRDFPEVSNSRPKEE